MVGIRPAWAGYGRKSLLTAPTTSVGTASFCPCPVNPGPTAGSSTTRALSRRRDATGKYVLRLHHAPPEAHPLSAAPPSTTYALRSAAENSAPASINSDAPPDPCPIAQSAADRGSRVVARVNRKFTDIVHIRVRSPKRATEAHPPSPARTRATRRNQMPRRCFRGAPGPAKPRESDAAPMAPCDNTTRGSRVPVSVASGATRPALRP